MKIGGWKLLDWLLYRYPTLRRVIVNLKSGKAFAGVLWRQRRGYLVLRDAALLEPRAEPKPLDGELLVYKSDVDFIQVI